MLHISVARHYCKGKLVASRITLSGTLATCGMETGNDDCRHDQNSNQLDSHCCDDVLVSYSIDNNYTPASKVVSGINQANSPAPVISFGKPVKIPFIVNRLWSDVSPPGEYLTSAVDLPEIRAFRI